MLEVRPDARGHASLPMLSLRGACDEAIHATSRSDFVCWSIDNAPWCYWTLHGSPRRQTTPARDDNWWRGTAPWPPAFKLIEVRPDAWGHASLPFLSLRGAQRRSNPYEGSSQRYQLSADRPEQICEAVSCYPTLHGSSRR